MKRIYSTIALALSIDAMDTVDLIDIPWTTFCNIYTS